MIAEYADALTTHFITKSTNKPRGHTMQGIITATEKLARIGQQFANIANGHPEYNKFGNAWIIPTDWTL